MEILIPVRTDGKRLLCLNVGCGMQKIKSFDTQEWINLDKSAIVKPDIVWDLDTGFPSKIIKGSVDVIYANHFIEHLHNPLFFLSECWERLSLGGVLYIKCPNNALVSHPCHKNFFSDAWFSILDPTHPEHYEIDDELAGSPCAFEIVKHKINPIRWAFKDIVMNGEELEIALRKVDEVPKDEGERSGDMC